MPSSRVVQTNEGISRCSIIAHSNHGWQSDELGCLRTARAQSFQLAGVALLMGDAHAA
jgi:hypothetical protein